MDVMMQIYNRKIGSNYPPLVIAEIGINHEGKLSVAKKMVDAAVRAGAEVIKHQTHCLEDEMSHEAKFVIPGNTNTSIYSVMERCALSFSDELELKKYVEEKGAIFISTPFSPLAVDRLIELNVPAIKIGSGECNNYPLIEYVASFKKPVILSTGMNNIETIKPAVEILREAEIQFALLHCTNIYPTPHNLVRLGGMKRLAEEFPDAVIGLSDHTVDIYSCLGAVALGACILERHFTDKKSRSGPDIECSMNPYELRSLIDGAKAIWLASGGDKEPTTEEETTSAFAFASVASLTDIKKGDILSPKNIGLMRPGGGDFTAKDLKKLFGKKCVANISSHVQLKKKNIEEK